MDSKSISDEITVQGASSSSSGRITQEVDDFLRCYVMMEIARRPACKKRGVTSCYRWKPRIILLATKTIFSKSQVKTTSSPEYGSAKKRRLWRKNCFSKKINLKQGRLPRHKSKGKKVENVNWDAWQCQMKLQTWNHPSKKLLYIFSHAGNLLLAINVFLGAFMQLKMSGWLINRAFIWTVVLTKRNQPNVKKAIGRHFGSWILQTTLTAESVYRWASHQWA